MRLCTESSNGTRDSRIGWSKLRPYTVFPAMTLATGTISLLHTELCTSILPSLPCHPTIYLSSQFPRSVSLIYFQQSSYQIHSLNVATPAVAWSPIPGSGWVSQMTPAYTATVVIKEGLNHRILLQLHMAGTDAETMEFDIRPRLQTKYHIHLLPL